MQEAARDHRAAAISSAQGRTEVSELRREGKYISVDEFRQLYRSACSVLNQLLRRVEQMVNDEAVEVQRGALCIQGERIDIIPRRTRSTWIAGRPQRRSPTVLQLSRILYNTECMLSYVCLLGMPVQRRQVFVSATLADVHRRPTLFGSNSPVEGVVGENECEDQYFLSVDAATEKNAWALAYRPVDRQFPSKRSVPLPREASSCLRWWLERNGRKMFILSPVKVQKITTTLRRRVETSSTINSLFLNSFGGQFSGECFGKVISQISRQFCGDRLTLSPRVFRKLKATYFIEYIMKNESNENRRQSLISRYAFLEGHSSETLLSHYFIKDSLSEQQDIMEVVEMANTACFVEADPESGEETLTDVDIRADPFSSTFCLELRMQIRIHFWP